MLLDHKPSRLGRLVKTDQEIVIWQENIDPDLDALLLMVPAIVMWLHAYCLVPTAMS